MKYGLISFLVFFSIDLIGQNLQLHYDPRHSLDPKHNPSNFCTIYFEYFKQQDSGTRFLKPGSFLLKMQSDLNGENGNIGKFYMQVSQSFRFWHPKIFAQLQYSGGLGIAEPGHYGFYISNAFSIGAGIPIVKPYGIYYASFSYTYNAFKRPSNDLLVAFYWWKGLWNYRIELAGDIECWTQNKNKGDAITSNLYGKLFSVYAEPQFWFRLSKIFYVGSKINAYYHVLVTENILQVYPTLAVKWKI